MVHSAVVAEENVGAVGFADGQGVQWSADSVTVSESFEVALEQFLELEAEDLNLVCHWVAGLDHPCLEMGLDLPSFVQVEVAKS